MNGEASFHPVCPYSRTAGNDTETHNEIIGGISIRQHFACEMMKALLVNWGSIQDRQQMDIIAQQSRELADALLRALP